MQYSDVWNSTKFETWPLRACVYTADVYGRQHGRRRAEEAGQHAWHLSVYAAAADGHGRVGQVHSRLLSTQPRWPGMRIIIIIIIMIDVVN